MAIVSYKKKYYCRGVPIQPGQRCQGCAELFDDELKTKCSHCGVYSGQYHRRDCKKIKESGRPTIGPPANGGY